MERTETQQAEREPAERAPASTTGQAAAANDCSCNCDYGCDCDCDYGCGCCCGCERAPTGLSIYQQARRMLMPDGEQGPTYRNTAQDQTQNQRRAPAEREPDSIRHAAAAENTKQEEEHTKPDPVTTPHQNQDYLLLENIKQETRDNLEIRFRSPK